MGDIQENNIVQSIDLRAASKAAWAAINKDKIRKACRDWGARNKARKAAITTQWQIDNPKRYAFLTQRSGALKRGITWEFAFDQWVEWWGEAFGRRGVNGEDFCMCRYENDGPYSPDNTYIATREENSGGPRC